MRCRVTLFLAAFLYYGFPGMPALAAPPIDFCEKNPESPLCDPGDPGDPPVDPCIEDPSACPVDPGSDPDPCEVDPASCEPPEEEPQIGTSGTLHGTLRAKGRAFRSKIPSVTRLILADAQASIRLHDLCIALSGLVETKATKRPKPAKSEVVLDEQGALALVDLAEVLAEEATGAEVGEALEQDVTISLKRDDAGGVLLKLKGSVTFAGAGKIALKARYEGELTTGPIDVIGVPGCM
jgi:hypothetical protein